MLKKKVKARGPTNGGTMRKPTARRRVRTVDEQDDGGGLVPQLSRSLPASTSLTKAKKKSKLSFTNDLAGDEDDEAGPVGMMGRASVRRRDDDEDGEETGLFRAPSKQQTVLLDLDKPAYGMAELEALRSESRRQSAVSVAASETVLAGDELEEMEEELELRQELLAAASAQRGEEKAGAMQEEEGGDGYIPTVEQIRVAREMRERLRKQGEDFIPLSGSANAPINVDEEDESRIVREKSDDSDDPFDEHRGAIKFGAPEGPDDRAKFGNRASRLNDSVINDWETELIRQAAGSGAMGDGGKRNMLLNDEEQQQPTKRRSNIVLRSGGSRISLEVIHRNVQSRVRDAIERCRIVREQLNSATVLESEGLRDLPAAKEELARLSARYNFMQRMREYVLNLISCLEYAIPQIEAIERDEAKEGATAAATASAARRVFENVTEEYSLVNVLASFDSFRVQYPQWFFGAHIDDSIAELVVPLLRWELLSWNVFESPEKLTSFKWFQDLANFGDAALPKSEVVFLNILHSTVVRRIELALARAGEPSDVTRRRRLLSVVGDLKLLFQGSPALLQPLLDRMKTV